MRGPILFLIASQAVFGGVLFTESFESPSGLGDGNWSTNGSGQVVANPQVDVNNSSSKVLNFTNCCASGGDLFSSTFNYSSAPGFTGQLYLSFDFLWQNTDNNSYIGTDHQPFSNEEWLWSSQDNGTHPRGPLVANTWTRVGFFFTPRDTFNFGSIQVKLEQNSGTTGASFFDNISVSTDAPEPSSAVGLLLGFAALAGNYFRRRPATLR